MNEERKSRRGPIPLDAVERRTHCVSVRLNDAELKKLDGVRGKFQRGEWLRMAALDELPPSIPEVNRDMWVKLARSAANLNQIAHHLNAREAVEVEEIQAALAAFRMALLGVVVDESDAEG